MDARNKRRLFALKFLTTLQKSHYLEVDKTEWYQDYYDNELLEKVFLRSKGVTLLMRDGKIVAFRENTEYFVVDSYEQKNV